MTIPEEEVEAWAKAIHRADTMSYTPGATDEQIMLDWKYMNHVRRARYIAMADAAAKVRGARKNAVIEAAAKAKRLRELAASAHEHLLDGDPMLLIEYEDVERFNDAATALESVTDELRTANRRIEGLETMRPVWDQGFTSENVAAQVTASALAGLWKILKAKNQTEAVLALKSLASRPQTVTEAMVEAALDTLTPSWRSGTSQLKSYADKHMRLALQSALAAAPPPPSDDRPKINEPFLPTELEDSAEGSGDDWYAKATMELARQLTVRNDFYYPLLGIAQILKRTPPPTSQMNVLAAMGDTIHFIEVQNLGDVFGATGLSHFRSMQERAADPLFSYGKRCRWLGWMQGAAAAHGWLTLEDAKTINKRHAAPPTEQDKP